MSGINLAPGTQYIITARKRRLHLYAIAIAIIGIFLAGWLGLYMYVNILASSRDRVKADIAQVNQQLEALQGDAQRVAFFEKRLHDVSQLLDNHIGWEKIFADVERLLPRDTTLTSFDATSGNSVLTVQGTTQNIDQIALALASLTRSANHPSVFSSGSVKTINRQQQASGEGAPVVLYTFTMTLEFNNSVLSKASL